MPSRHLTTGLRLAPAALALMAAGAGAGEPAGRCVYHPAPCGQQCAPSTLPGTTPGTAPGMAPGTMAPSVPGTTPSAPSTTPGTTPAAPAPAAPTPFTSAPGDAFAFSAPQGALGAADTVAARSSVTGYIDPAVVFSHVRLRFDAGYGNDFPDRAEFFYAKCGCFKMAGLDDDANGPPLPETNIDYQDVAAHLEVAANERFSVFAELPVRFLNPDQNENTAGLADMNFGAKYALIAAPDQYLTAQLRVYAPTGDSERGLGNDHATVEPGLLYFGRSRDVILQGEARYWAPVGDTTDFAGDIVRYGVGLGYVLTESQDVAIVPVVEVVGWTLLDGLAFNPETNVIDVEGDTIVNLKVGTRFTFGGPGLLAGENSSLYVGWGHALTDDVWYEDIARVEYRILF